MTSITYFETIEGKQIQKTISGKQLEEHKDICFTVFGAVPLDYIWTLQNPIYKKEVEMRKSHNP